MVKNFFNLNERLRVLDALLIEHHAHLHRQSCHVRLGIEESVSNTCLAGSPCTTDLMDIVFCGTYYENQDFVEEKFQIGLKIYI